MTKFILGGMTCALIVCAQPAKAETFTADDFVGENKICTQIFYGNDLVGFRPQDYGWGKFEIVDREAGRIKLSSFKNEGEVNFIIDGDKLYLEGTDTKTGAQCGEAQLRPVKLQTYSPAFSKKEYIYFIDSPEEYIGTIVREGNEVKITFDSGYLSFRKRSSDAVSVGNYPNFKNDFFNTFSKCVLYIHETDNSIQDDQINLITGRISEDKFIEKYNVANIDGLGRHCIFTDNGYEINADGIVMTINKAEKTFELPAKEIGCHIDYYFDGIFISGVNGLLGTYGVLLNNMSLSNILIEGNEPDGSVKGSYEVLSYSVTPGWHKSHNGDFEVLETILCTGDWASYFVNIDNGSRNQRNDMATHTFRMQIETTPEAELEITQCDYNNYGILTSGTITADIHSDVVESYNVYVIGGHHDDATGDSFDATLEEGHEGAVLIAENLVPDDNGKVSFQHLTYFNETVDKGWNPIEYKGRMTYYLRYNLTNGEHVDVTRNNKRKASLAEDNEESQEEPETLFSFGTMSQEEGSVVTGIDQTFENTPEISVVGGIIRVRNAKNVSIYDASGKTIYNGTSSNIKVGEGLYIVKADNTVKKIIIRD